MKTIGQWFLCGVVVLGVLSIPAHTQELAPAQAVSRDLGAAPIPSDISVNGVVDRSIPSLLARLKREVRSWLNAKIALLPANPDPAAMQKSLVADLGEAGLLADSNDHDHHPFGKLLGIGISSVPGEPNLLRAVISYDAFCPPDDSVLYFERRNQKWRLLLNFDNTDFSKPHGDRQLLYAGISPRDRHGQFYVFIVRTRSYCPGSGSVWNNINYHVLRPGPDPESPRIIHSAKHGYREDGDCRILLARDSLMMDFPDWSITASIARTHILKYTINKGTARRVDPIAVDPEGFVEEWMMSPWSSASEWSDPAQKSLLKFWHERLNVERGETPKILGDEAFRQICGPDRSLIQISFPADSPATGPDPGELFFLVRELGPHVYRLFNISQKSAYGCSSPQPNESQGEHLLPESMNRRKQRPLQ